MSQTSVTAAPVESPQPVESRWLQASRWTAYVTAGGLWTYTIRWSYGPLPTTMLENLIGLTVVLYIVGAWRSGRRRPVSTGYEIPIALLLIAGAISVYVAKDHRGALGLYRAYFIEPVIFFYAAADMLRRTGDFRRLLAALAIGSSAFALINFAVFIRAVHAHALHIGNAPQALYGDANYVAMYFDPIVAMAAGLLLFGGSRLWRAVGGAWLLIAGTAHILTFSKGGYLALAAIGVVAVASVPRWRVPLLAGLIVAALAISRIPPIALRLSESYGSIMGRAQIFSATIKMIQDNPLLGVGLGGYSFHFRGRIPEVYPHDLWLTFWVETGLLGVLAFTFILLALMWRAVRAIRLTNGLDRAALWGVLAGLAAWTVHGIVDSPYWKNDMSLEFWIMAALEVAVIRLVTGGSVSRARRAGP